ncbi:MAG TPA: response regulator [Tepidisphaeraceae bacterium]|nr:response regulator [Tepidisphaeraceae bacterium]
MNPLRILLVVDDPDTLNVLRRLLAREGHDVLTAMSVAGGMEIARAGDRLDLLISDIALPDGSGFDLMAGVKALHALPGIALSGYVDQRDKQRAADAGFCVHLNKPVRFDDVIRAIESCMEGDAVMSSNRRSAPSPT